MRDWIKLFEYEEDNTSYEREQYVTAKILDECRKAGIADLADRNPVVYMEDENRAAVISIEGRVTLEQIEALKPLGLGFYVTQNNRTNYGVQIHFTASKALDPMPARLKR